MAATIIDGNALAAAARSQVQAQVEEMKSAGKRVHLSAVLVGSTAAGELYAKRQHQACATVGIDYDLITLPPDADHAAVANTIHRLNSDASVTGIMLHLPLPKHLNPAELQYAIDPVKDVEGVNPANIGNVVYGHTLIAPCTARAVIELIEWTQMTLEGAEAVVVGASEIAGKPIALLLAEKLATVTLCHVATRDLPAHTQRADLLVCAVGRPGLITAAHIRPGAVVIDVGINRVRQADGTFKTTGDVDFEPGAKKPDS